MNTYTLGQVVRLSSVTKDISVAPVDPATITYVATLQPAGPPVTLSPLIRDGMGLYHYDFEPALHGTYTVTVTTTNPDSIAQEQIYFAPPY